MAWAQDVVVGVFVGSICYSLGGQVMAMLHERTARRRELWFGGGCCSLGEYTSSRREYGSPMPGYEDENSDFRIATETDRLTAGDVFI